jgi:hypothetical protein
MRKVILIPGLGLAALIFSYCTDKGSGHSTLNLPKTDSLPLVLSANKSDIVDKRLRYEAALRYAEHQLPGNKEEWLEYRTKLRKAIIDKAAVLIDHDLPLDIRETGSIRMKNYVIKNIAFQVRPGIYATANLFIPDGEGPFPGVINMLGHWRKGKIDPTG